MEITCRDSMLNDDDDDVLCRYAIVRLHYSRERCHVTYLMIEVEKIIK